MPVDDMSSKFPSKSLAGGPGGSGRFERRRERTKKTVARAKSAAAVFASVDAFQVEKSWNGD